MAWPTTGMTASRDSVAPFGLPGTLMIRVLFRTPAIERDTRSIGALRRHETPARLLEQSNRLDGYAPFDSLCHVDERERGDGGRCERLDLDPRLADHPCPGQDALPAFEELKIDVDSGQREGVTEGDELRCAPCGHDARDAQHLHRVSFRG